MTVSEGDVISIDGTSGTVYAGDVPVVASPVVEYFEGNIDPRGRRAGQAVHRIMAQADDRRRLGVRANSDNGADSARAVRFGAQGIGLTRTEHMFLGERRQLVEQLILAEDDASREAALARSSRCSAATSSRSSRRWTGCRSRSGCSTRRCTSSCPT